MYDNHDCGLLTALTPVAQGQVKRALLLSPSEASYLFLRGACIFVVCLQLTLAASSCSLKFVLVLQMLKYCNDLVDTLRFLHLFDAIIAEERHIAVL